ncbi:MAG: excinuclease ABC subunit UvrA [Chloroflexi bacterium]|nr:excinuclease ABC subunit UvrA [Chloroflexota bacterium]MCI0576767.1 excinuclease ABC subunit UvrA [Chloroflexota bacterium]MCI0645971.1 excinuclease ABC subunit UvrA [Chloroflexota bacterium]MCI0731483.1 excinuclease ABC subunit UvrA [Chloroflexota bacterium]
MSLDKIIVRGAREHNLKNITVEIPRDRLVVITGLSGSGKSSLAFDTIFAEGQRRYVESLSAYARQFLGQLEKPDVDQIEGLSPAVSIDQKGVSHNPRSTVGTVTEIYDYLRLLYARVGTPHCPLCGRPVMPQSAEQIVESVQRMTPNSRIQVLAPLIKDRKGHHQAVFEDVRKAGFVRVRVDGEIYQVDEEIELDRYKNHSIEAVVDRLVVRYRPEDESEEAKAARSRLTDSIETALRLGDGVVIINDVTDPDHTVDHLYSEHLFCAYDGTSVPDIEPRTFSFNSPHGACPDCQGLGTKKVIDPDLVAPNKDLSLHEGAVIAWPTDDKQGYYWQLLKATADHFAIPADVPLRKLNDAQMRVLLYGSGQEEIKVRYTNREGDKRTYKTNFEGVVPNLERRYRESTSDYVRLKLEEFMVNRPCRTCDGTRLQPVARAVDVAGQTIAEMTRRPVADILEWVKCLHDEQMTPLTRRQQLIAASILKEVRARLEFMINVGLDYLTLDRSAGSLSGGEAQRIRLATQIGSRLMGVLYVLDEPSIGLHQRDNERLIHTLMGMRDLGNTVLVVEHDEDTIRHADWVLDLGPGAGLNGGWVVAEGTVKDITANENSLTGDYLSGRKHIPIPRKRRKGTGQTLVVRGATENNLKNIDVRIPLGKFVCITGVSGSGKSTFLIEILSKRLNQVFYKSRELPGAHQAIEGLEHLDKVIEIDQSPIGRTPRSNPATYTNLFNQIRDLFAGLPDSKLRGYKSGRFSFNVKGGRCEACEGQGQNRIEMQFLPDIYVPCDVCKGARYNRETLQVTYKGLNIAQVLDLSVEEALDFFANIPPIRRKLQTLHDVGLGYVRLGQPAPTLSGGEAQRVKLSRELSKIATGNTIYILDEPSVGLHAHDVARLIQALNRLVDKGNTVIIIEHNMDIIKVADHLIDLGPEGGQRGGEIVAEGTPEEVAAVPRSYTGQFLQPYLNGRRS